MSSACVCHTNEWCFYHEMYVPLEKQRDDSEFLYQMEKIKTDMLTKERDSLIQALRDGFADDVQHPTKADLLYWITSTCPWLENKFDET